VRRNKWKIGVLAAAGGAVCYYYGSAIRQAWTIYKLMNEMSEKEGLVDERRGSAGGKNNSVFERTITTSDETAVKLFPAIKTQINELYDNKLARVQSELRRATISVSDREDLFAKFHVLIFSRLVASIVLTRICLLLSRVEVCVISQGGAELAADHRELLSSLRMVLTCARTVGRINGLCKKITEKGLTDLDISATTVVEKKEGLIALTDSISSAIVSELSTVDSSPSSSTQSQKWSWLLGSLVDSTPESIPAAQVWDIIESPQWELVLEHSIRTGLERAVARTMPTDKLTFPAAAMLPNMKVEPDWILSNSTEGIYATMFRDSAVVTEFSTAVFGQQATSDDESEDPNPDMEKLGMLLEKLVKADVEKK
jgi:molybdenum-dependent DNA-binding transcriptional regulator ModE